MIYQYNYSIAEEKPQIIDVLSKYGGITVKKRRGRCFIPCFSHNEKTPSMMVDVKKNRVYCFGCHWHGDSYDVISFFTGRPLADVLREHGKTQVREEDREKQRLLKRFNEAVTAAKARCAKLIRLSSLVRLPNPTDENACIVFNMMALTRQCRSILDKLEDNDTKQQLKGLEEFRRYEL